MQIISLGLTHGSTHDFQLFKAQRKKQRYQAFMLIDKGYLGLNRLGIKCLMPFKASKKKPLTLLQKQINREISRPLAKVVIASSSDLPVQRLS